MNCINENTMGGRHFFFLWFGAAVSVAEILTGGLIAPLGFRTGVQAILLGHLIGCGVLALGGIIGTQTRLPALSTTRIAFGLYGSYLFSGLNILQLIGWTAVMISTGAASVNQISKAMWGYDQLLVWNIIIGACVMLWVMLGREGGWKKVNMVAVALLLALTAVLSATVFKDMSLWPTTVEGEMTFGGAVELSAVMPLSWLPLISDYTRFAKTSRAGAVGSWFGYFFGSCWMYIIGLGAAIAAGSADPAAIMLAANLGLSALGVVALATITTTFMDAYSAGVSLVNIMPHLSEKMVAAVLTVLGTVLALLFNMEEYETFLYAIGSVFGPLFAVLLTEYFGFGTRSPEPDLAIHYGALAVWALGVAMYYQFIKFDFVLGATIPVMLITGAFYAVIRRCVIKWRSLKKLPQTC